MTKIIISTLPKSVDDLKNSALDFHQPETVVAYTIATLLHYEENPQETYDMLDYLGGPKNLSVYDKQFIKDRLVGKYYVPKSYFVGTSPANNYTPSQPYTIEVSETAHGRDQISEGYLSLGVQSSGADSIRTVKLRYKKSEDNWYLWEMFMLSDIRIPQELDPWA